MIRKLHWLNACEGRTTKEFKNGNVNLVKPRILRLDVVCRSLDAYGYWLVPEDDVSRSQLPVCMEKDLGFKNPRQVRFVD